MRSRFSDKLSYIFIAVIALVAVRGFFASGFFAIHDSTHVARLYLMDLAVRAGQLPPLWANSANFGYGYPLFHFYAPLAYYFALFAKLFTSSYLVAIKASFVFAYLLAGIGMYKLARRWGRGVAMLSTIAYLLTPYLAVNLFVRGALAELWAIALLPWLFHAWSSLVNSRTSVARTAIITSLFLLSHNLIPLITAPFLLIWIIIYHHDSPRPVILASIFTLLLSSFYLLPLVFERGFVQVESIARTTDYTLHFVEPKQLWNSTWGFGGSAVGVEDGMSFKLGKLHILLALFSLFLLKKRPQLRMLLVTCYLFLLTTIFFSTSYSQIVWDNLSYLQLVQFPWRFLSLIAFFLAILAGFSISIFRNKLFKAIYLLITISSLIFLNLKYFSPQGTLSISDDTYTAGNYIFSTLAGVVPEYLPAWMEDFPTTPASDLPTTLTGPETIILPRAYYPTWQATLSGVSAPITSSPEGLIALDVPEGTYDLSLTQTHTPLERVASILSLTTIIYLIYYTRRASK